MSDPIQCQILDAFEEVLNTVEITNSKVYRGKVYNKDSLPCQAVYFGQGTQDAGHAFNDSKLQIKQLITVTEHEKNLDSKTWEVFADSYAALMTDQTLGLASVIQIEPTGNREPEILSESSKPIQATEFTWEIQFRHSVNDTRT